MDRFVKNKRDSVQLLIIDGCSEACGKSSLMAHDFSDFDHFDHFKLTDLGLVKSKTMISETLVRQLAACIK